MSLNWQDKSYCRSKCSDTRGRRVSAVGAGLDPPEIRTQQSAPLLEEHAANYATGVIVTPANPRIVFRDKRRGPTSVSRDCFHRNDVRTGSRPNSKFQTDTLPPIDNHGAVPLDYDKCRGVAQSGSVPEWGSGGRWFKSSRPDQTRIGEPLSRRRPFDGFSLRQHPDALETTLRGAAFR